jgi:hypothetical protein
VQAATSSSGAGRAVVATFKNELVDGLCVGSFERTERETLAWLSSYDDESLHQELGDVRTAENERKVERLTGLPASERSRTDKRESASFPSNFYRSIWKE